MPFIHHWSRVIRACLIIVFYLQLVSKHTFIALRFDFHYNSNHVFRGKLISYVVNSFQNSFPRLFCDMISLLSEGTVLNLCCNN